MIEEWKIPITWYRNCRKISVKILIISNDPSLSNLINEIQLDKPCNISIYTENSQPLDIATYAFSLNPVILILDDDNVKPNSSRIIKSLKKMIPNIAIIFLTSSSSVELGREISQLGIQYYAIKPLSQNELQDSINSIVALINKKSTLYNKQKEDL